MRALRVGNCPITGQSTSFGTKDMSMILRAQWKTALAVLTLPGAFRVGSVR